MHKSINYRQENAGTSCLGRKTGSDAIFNFTIAFHIQRNLLREKTAQINQLQAVKRWHFLFGEQNRKQRHFWLHHGVPHPEKPSPWESSVNQSITDGKMWPLPVWRAKQEVKSFWTSPSCTASLKTPILKIRHGSINIWQENADTSCIPVKFVSFPLYFPQTFHWLKLGSVS